MRTYMVIDHEDHVDERPDRVVPTHVDRAQPGDPGRDDPDPHRELKP